MQEVALPSIRIGYDYAVTITFPAGFLDESEGAKAELRQSAAGPLLVTFVATREGDTITLSLPEELTADLPEGSAMTELVLTSAGVPDIPVPDTRFVAAVVQHTTQG